MIERGGLARLIGRAVGRVRATTIGRALDRTLDLRYLADRWLHEDARIAALLAGRPRSRLLVSVVTPVYGIANADLSAFLESFIRQSHARSELCLCNDGDDGAAATIERWRREHPERVRVASHEQNLGIAAATRTALSLARGEIVAFADADDLLHPRALELIADAFGDEDVDLVYTDHDRLTQAGMRVAPVAKPGLSPELLGRVNYINHLVAARAELVRGCAVAFADDASGAQDWRFLLHAARRARRVVHVPVVLYHWRARPDSLAASTRAKPWAVARALEVQRRFVEELDPRLTVVGEDFRSVRLVPRVLPRVVCVGDVDAEYDGPLETMPMASAEPAALATALDELARELNDDDLLLVTRSPYRGALSTAAAYAMLRSTGAVWPFRDRGLRRAYTIAHGAQTGALTPIDRRRSAFSAFTGNVLTGPLDGLLTSGRAIRAVSGFTAALAKYAPGAASPDALGAAFGVAGLAHELRNVAVSNVECAGAFEPVVLADAPTIDVYA